MLSLIARRFCRPTTMSRITESLVQEALEMREAENAVICNSIDIGAQKVYKGRTFRSFQSEVSDG